MCHDAIDTNAAEQALVRLYELEASGRLWEKSALAESMKSLYATTSEVAGSQVQVMTLHKAKGLEFDTVILPALDRQPRGDSTQLLNWFESTLDGQAQLLLAPLEQSGLPIGRREAINRLVRKARERCDAQEKLRLLYVACTRAKKHLHLIARARHKADGQYQTPINSSLLRPLWPLLENHFEQLPDTHNSEEQAASTFAGSEAGALKSDTHEQMALDMGTSEEQMPVFERLATTVSMPDFEPCLLYTSPSPRDRQKSRMPSSA